MSAANWIALVAVIVSPLVSIYILRKSSRREDDREAQRRTDALDREQRDRAERDRERWLEPKRAAYADFLYSTRVARAVILGEPPDDVSAVLAIESGRDPWEVDAEDVRQGLPRQYRDLELIASDKVAELAQELVKTLGDRLFVAASRRGDVLRSGINPTLDDEAREILEDYGLARDEALVLEARVRNEMRRDIGLPVEG